MVHIEEHPETPTDFENKTNTVKVATITLEQNEKLETYQRAV